MYWVRSLGYTHIGIDRFEYNLELPLSTLLWSRPPPLDCAGRGALLYLESCFVRSASAPENAGGSACPPIPPSVRTGTPTHPTLPTQAPWPLKSQQSVPGMQHNRIVEKVQERKGQKVQFASNHEHTPSSTYHTYYTYVHLPSHCTHHKKNIFPVFHSGIMW